MKYIIIAIIALLSIGAGVLLFVQNDFSASSDPTVDTDPTTDVEPDDSTDTDQPADESDDETSDESDTSEARPDEEVIGTSAGGHDITAHHFGSGDETVLFVGGIHGGYSYNTALVAYDLIDYLDTNPDVVPENLTVTVVPVLNADGFMASVGTTDRFEASQMPTPLSARVPSRFNDNEVDINRNFDCEWQATGTWQSQSVSGGDAPFSEPETQAIRDLAASTDLRAVVAWYSAAGGVYGSDCQGSGPAETDALVDTFAEAADYPAYDSFDAYTVTGDMVNYFAGEGVPAFSVLLSDHTSSEWNKNRAGVNALLESLTQ